MGLKFNLMKDTAYDRGGTRTNPKEAKAIAEAVIHHARTSPEQTLGVATFSVAQRQAVLKELELLRRANPDVEDFFSGASNEPFFVKNLENIQGDERDVIFISVGYGKTETGYLAHAFGPLSGEGGERRLSDGAADTWTAVRAFAVTHVTLRIPRVASALSVTERIV
ncbi:hypothetical protein [Brevundimonas sp.]|uniref:hypothetical protein n=1 Tax=Brevundimonas sp. TaxID=1871086 RepID=UPI0028A754A0|nr:hypothetical protein [Brevundimonas sp.]